LGEVSNECPLCDRGREANDFKLEGTHVLTEFYFPGEDSGFDEGAESRHHLWGDGVMGVSDIFVYVFWIPEDQVEATVVTAGG
jgi:hypothetical protein